MLSQAFVPSSKLVREVLRSTEAQTPVLLLSPDHAVRQFKAMSAALPGVGIHYSLKPNPHPAVVDALHKAGCCFEVASSGEIDVLRRAHVNMDEVLHTNPMLKRGDISYALEQGVKRFVVDNASQMLKMAEFKQHVELLVHLRFEAKKEEAVLALSKKFGALPDVTAKEPTREGEPVLWLLRRALELGLRVYGVSFHCGSELYNPREMLVAINQCRRVVDEAGKMGVQLTTVDIGGGFPAVYADQGHPERLTKLPSLDEYFEPVRTELAKLFDVETSPGSLAFAHAQRGKNQPVAAAQDASKAKFEQPTEQQKEKQTQKPSQLLGVSEEEAKGTEEAAQLGRARVRVIAEPGRFIAAPCMALVTTVVSKGKLWCYLDDGCYGTFASEREEHLMYPLFPLKHLEEAERTGGQRDAHGHPLQTSVTPTSSEGKDKDKSQGQGTDKGKQQGKGEGDGGGVPTVLAGPTCDSSDISYQDLVLPRELEVGDHLITTMVGAYTWVLASDFNLLPRVPIRVV